MKLRSMITMAAVAGLALAPGVQAQMELELTPFAGGTFFLADPPSEFALATTSGQDLILENASFDRSFTLGLNAGLRFGERWAVEGMFSWIPTTLSASAGLPGEADVNAYMYGLTGLYYVPLTDVVSPFFGLGVGGETFDYQIEASKTHHQWMGNAVVGLYLRVNDLLGLRFEARDCIARFDSGVAGVDDAWENDLMTTMGLSFRMPLR